MTTTLNIIGLKVVALKGYATNRELRKKKPQIPVQYIFFDDGETLIRLEEQDYYSYHDCSSYAREIYVIKDKESYDNAFKFYYDSTIGRIG